MKEANAFLISNLKKVFLKLENVEISYEFRNSSQTHIVEVKPNSVYKTCENYIKQEMELESFFYKNFPNEILLFITEDSLTKIKSPDLVLKYKLDYNSHNSFTPISLDSILSKNQLAKAGENNYALAA
jgi:hypothetical protein